MDTELDALLDLHAAQAIEEFWESTQRVVHSALPVATCWFAPLLGWLMPCAAFRAEMSLTEPEFRRLQGLHPLVAFLRANPTKMLARLSDLLPEAALLNSKFYREFLAPFGHRFSVVLSFWQGTSMQGLLGVRRAEGDGDFSKAELRTLGELHRHIGTALRRVCLLHRARSAHRALEVLLVSLPVPTAVLDWELAVLYCNYAARQLGALWKTASDSARCLKCDERFELPAEVRQHCQKLKTEWQPRRERVRKAASNQAVTLRHACLPGLQASVRVLHLDTPMLAMPVFVVVFADPRGQANLRIPQAEKRLAQLARLSAREREVASLVSEGESNKEVAAKLGKSVFTVKAQLHSIYEKLGLAGRSKLISLLQDGNGSRVQVM